MNQRALLLVNRNARRGQANHSEAVEELRQLGFTLLEESIDKAESPADTIRRYSNRIDLVIIGGGDGTLNAAVEGLLDTQLPLGILPLGTANDLARTLKIPTDLSQACQIIAAGNRESIDLGWVNGKHFFNVASLGLSVEITRNLSKDMKRRWGVLAYAATALKVLWQSRPFSAHLRIDDGEPIRLRTAQIAVGNGRYYGGGMTVTEEATIDDQRLDVYSLNVRQWWQWLLLLPGMRSGTHTSWSFVDHFRCQAVEIRTQRPLPINTDGELTTRTPARFRVVPQAVTVFVPIVPNP